MADIERRVIIIGGGIAGIATAYYLKRHLVKSGKKFEIILIEKEDRWGGTILSLRDKGFLIEGGPDCFITEKPWALNLSKEIGLEKRLVGTNDDNRQIFILSGGKLKELPEGFSFLVPTSFMPFIRSDLISLPGKLRILTELFIPRKNSNKQESFSDFVVRRLGRETLEKIAEPLVSNIYATNPDEMCIETTFPNLLDLEKKYGSIIKGILARRKMMAASANSTEKVGMFMTFKDGMEELVNSLISKLDKKWLIKNSPVVKLERKSKNSGFQITIKDGGELVADAVVIATPAYVAGNLLHELDQNLARTLLEIPYVSTGTISLGYNMEDLHNTFSGFGFLIPRMEERKIMAATFCSIKFKERAPENKFLLRCFIGGAKGEDILSLDDETLLKVAKEELKDITGIKAQPILTRLYRWEKAMPQYILNHKEKIERIRLKTEDHPGLFLTGSGYRGIGIPDCINEAMHTSESIVKFLFN
ncbi:MAG: protoporphyrinogen oxidase [Thermodesulfobacteriota bacterium]|nr:protoporphyrinogen oxidase [Thermodesulfobacteriota bacterium]